MQVDNPVAVLNQDAAKSFLYKCDADKLYQFFMRATQLENCKQEYNAAGEEKQAAEKLMKAKKKELPLLEHEQDKWNKKLQVCINGVRRGA